MNCSIDSQLIDKIFKFASIKHILNNNQNNHDKIFDLLEEIMQEILRIMNLSLE